MSAFTVAHVSDTHLGARCTDFEGNFQALVQELGRTRPDLVVNTGDLTIDGAHDEHDHRRAHELHQTLQPTWRVLPGNHDLGDNPPAANQSVTRPVTPERLARYRGVWGADWWAQNAGEFRLIGINAQLLGADGLDEAAQWDWLANELKESGDRPLALFLHKPLFLRDPDDEPVTHRFVPLAPRRRLLAMTAKTRLRLVASGHVHQHRFLQMGEVLHAWGPSSAYILPNGFQPVLGTKRVGYNLYHLQGDTVTAQVCTPAVMANNDLVDFPTPYGSVLDIMTGRTRYDP